MSPTLDTILWILLLFIGVNSQGVQQQYFPTGRYFWRQWSFASRTRSLDGRPPGILVARTQQGFLVFNQNPQAINGDRGLVMMTVVEPWASTSDDGESAPQWIAMAGRPAPQRVAIEEGPAPQRVAIEEGPAPQSIVMAGGPAPQSVTMDHSPSTDDGLSGAIESQTGPGAGNPVGIDAAENKVVYSRKKRQLDPWKIFSGISQSFLPDKRNRGSKASSSRREQSARVKRSRKASNSAAPSVGIMEKRVIPVVENVDETRRRRGTDDNLSSQKYAYRSRRHAEV